MAKYSNIYRFNGRLFRYDYEDAVVELLMRDEGKLEVIDSVGLRRENWKNKEARDEYLFEYCMDLDEEASYLLEEFLRFG